MQKKNQNPKTLRRKDAASCMVKKVLDSWEVLSTKSLKDKEYGYGLMLKRDDKKIILGFLCSIMATSGDSSSDLAEDEKTRDTFMLAVEDNPLIYDSLFEFLENIEHKE